MGVDLGSLHILVTERFLNRANVILEPIELDLQHLAIQEQQGIEGLILRGGRHIALRGQKGEEDRNLPGAHVPRMAAMEIPDEVPDPVVIGLLGAAAVMQCTDPVAHLIHEPGPWYGSNPV